MKQINRWSAFLMLLLFEPAIYAQHALLDFNQVKEANGITLGKITGITQDRSGYMWFADQGNSSITRFDGYKMKTYRYDPSDSNSLSNKGVEAIAADSSGCVWAGTATGVDKFDPATNKFIHFRYPPGEIGNRDVYNILIDHLGIVWIGTSGGLDRLDQHTKKFIQYTHNDNDTTSLSCNIVRCLYEDHEGVLWVGTGWEFDSTMKEEGGLNRFNRKTGTFTRYMHDPNNSQSLAGNKVKAIFEDSRGVFWVGTEGDGLHTMDRKTGAFERLTYDPQHPEKLSRPPLKTGKDWADHITFITEDGAGAIWIGTYYAGLVRYDPRTKEITHYDSTDKSRPKGFTDNSGWCAYTSRDGVLWIATESEGNGGENLFRIDPLQTGIANIKLGDELSCIYQDSSGKKWTGFRTKGLLETDTSKNIKKYFKHDANNPASLSSDDIFFIEPDTDGFFWVGTFNGLNRFDSKTGRFTRYFYNTISKGDYVDTAIFVLKQGNNGDVYISTNVAFIIMNLRTGLIKRYVNDPADSTSIGANFATGLCKDKSGNLWVGTWTPAGLNLFDIKTKKFKHYLVGNRIRSIYKDTRGTIWVGTDYGLYYHKDSADSFIHVDEWNKEFSTAALQVQLEDDDKNLWGSSSLGIFRFNAQKHELCFYKNKFGVSDTPFNHFRKSFKTADKTLVFSNNSGYYSFLPRDLINNVPPEIILTDFKINGKSIAPGNDAPYNGSIEQTKDIQLQYNQNNFSIDFAAIHYSSPEDNIHYYMLEEYDDNWITADSLKTANYYNVPPGKYTFKIKASSSYGIWSERAVRIIIYPPWWLTWWFITSAIILAIIAFYLPIRWWLNRKFRQQLDHAEKEKQIAELNQKTIELELAALRAQMNPHFIFNSLNSINRFIINSDGSRAADYLTKFAKLIRIVLEQSGKSFVPLEDELKCLQLYMDLEALRFEIPFKYEIDYNEIDISSVMIPTLLIQPFVENAIWHGLQGASHNNGKITINMHLKDNILHCKIGDNGIGRAASAIKEKGEPGKTSLGINITQHRLQLLDPLKKERVGMEIHDIINEAGHNTGTCVDIKIPVKTI